MTDSPQELQAFADRLSLARIQASLTQEQAAKKAGVTTGFWNRLECGKYRPLLPYRQSKSKGVAAKRLARIETFAAAVGLTLDDLVTPPENTQ